MTETIPQTRQTPPATDTAPRGGHSEAEAQAHAAGKLSARSRTLITLLLVATFVVILNETIMGVALPRVMEDLGIDASVGQWLTTAFLLTMAVVIPISGYLIQRFPTRVLFGLAMSLFSAGTLIAALAPGFPVLLLARVVQASGTAIMLPLLMTTVMTLVPPASRGKMMGNISIVISVAPAIGPTISGLVLHSLSWRFIFWIVLPIALVSLILGLILVVSVGERTSAPIDIVSIPLAALGFGSLVYALSSIGEAADGSALMPIWIPFVVGALALAAFIARQLVLQRQDRALLDLRTFRSRVFTASVVTMAITMSALFGTIILLPIYLQTALGLEPLTTGLLVLPGGITMGILGPVVGRLYDKFGPRVLLVPGTAVVSGALWLLAFAGAAASPWYVGAVYLILSIGLAFTFTPLFTSGLGSVQPRLYSHGSAIIGTVQQVAGAAGAALFVTVLAVAGAGVASAGGDAAAQAAAGTHSAFMVAASISMVGIITGLFVKRSANAPDMAMHH